MRGEWAGRPRKELKVRHVHTHAHTDIYDLSRNKAAS